MDYLNNSVVWKFIGKRCRKKFRGVRIKEMRILG